MGFNQLVLLQLMNWFTGDGYDVMPIIEQGNSKATK